MNFEVMILSIREALFVLLKPIRSLWALVQPALETSTGRSRQMSLQDVSKLVHVRNWIEVVYDRKLWQKEAEQGKVHIGL